MSQVIDKMRFCKVTNRLIYGTIGLCRIRKNATNQRDVLEAIAVSGFDTFIDSPLWDDEDDEFTNQSRTTKTVTQLNKIARCIRFSTFDKGRYIKWELTGAAKETRDEQCQR